jgi:murein DD-endopeptidase MepM/ murein hydrolase activator NlpD
VSGASSVGHILLQPERLPRTAADDGEQALLDDLLTAIARIVADVAQGGTMAQDLEAAFEALGKRLLEHAGVGFHAAVGRIGDLVAPLASMIKKLPELLDHDDAAEVASALLDLLGTLGEKTSGLSIEAVRKHVTLVLDVIEKDLGLTSSVLEDELWALFGDVIERLEITPDGLDPALAANRLAVAGTLRGIRRRCRGIVKFPALSADKIAEALFDELDALLGPALEKAACVGHVTADGVSALKSAKQAVPFTGFDSRTLGAAGTAPPNTREYLWYASWLLADDVWIDRGESSAQAMLVDQRLVLRTGELPCQDGLPSWLGIMVPTSDAQEFAKKSPDKPIPTDWDRSYRFDDVSPATMERVAFHSAWIADALQAECHIWFPLSGFTNNSLKIKKGGSPSATDMLDLLYGGLRTGVDVSQHAPLDFLLKPGLKGTFAGLAPTAAFHLAGSLQGMHWKASTGGALKMWVVLLVSDGFSYVTPYALTSAVRDGVLSFLTSLNYTDKDGVSDNLRHTEGLIGVVQAVMNIVLTKSIFPSKYYGQPFTGNSTQITDWWLTVWLEYLLLLSTLWGALSWMLGTVGACSLARKATVPPGWGGTLAKTVAKSVGLFFVNLYANQENGTKDGKLNLEGASPFAGYPDPATSPYKLPWAAGKSYICGQGNLGLFSHNFTNPAQPQVYAYDFMIDHGDEVLAARGGVVVDYFDWVATGEGDATPAGPEAVSGQTGNDQWNFIAIRHDPDAKHDLGAGGAAVTTYAVYGHGLLNGVRDVFAARSPAVAPAAIIGTTVKQGEPIMLADSTGVSLCDHVHMEVRVGPAPAPVPPPVSRGLLTITIPFVFNDGGQPSTLEWLQSDNARVPAP